MWAGAVSALCLLVAPSFSLTNGNLIALQALTNAAAASRDVAAKLPREPRLISRSCALLSATTGPEPRRFAVRLLTQIALVAPAALATALLEPTFAEV